MEPDTCRYKIGGVELLDSVVEKVNCSLRVDVDIGLWLFLKINSCFFFLFLFFLIQD